MKTKQVRKFYITNNRRKRILEIAKFVKLAVEPNFTEKQCFRYATAVLKRGLQISR